MKRVARHVTSLLIGSSLLITSGPAAAVKIGGVEFPQGDYSFADAVVSYNPSAGGGLTPSAANAQPTHALDAPEVPGNTSVAACTYADTCPFVSLGDGGSIVLKFTDNFLTGSNSPAADLWIFEVGPDIESTYVEISKDGSQWFKVGRIAGTTASVDIDAYGFTASDTFAYVKLTDDPAQGGKSGTSVGADIDAIGAISTIINPEVANEEDKAFCFNTNDVVKEAHDAGYVEGVADGKALGYDLGVASCTATTTKLTNDYQTAVTTIEKLKTELAAAQQRIRYLQSLPQLKGVLKQEAKAQTKTQANTDVATTKTSCNNGVGNGSDGCTPGKAPIANDENGATKGNPAASNGKKK